MTHDFTGRTVVITGAAGVYGREFASRFAAAGANLFLTDKTVDSLEGTHAGNPSVRIHAADLTRDADLETLCGAVLEEFGPPDVVVNNAGVYPFGGLFDTSLETFDQVFSINVRANFEITRRLSRAMIDAARPGVFVFIGSAAAHVLRTNGLAYCASKRALEWMMKGIALELGQHGIRVNMLEPGLAQGSLGADFPDGYVEAITGQIPLRRLIEPGEAADALLFLASENARYVNGATLAVDGGGSIPHRQRIS
ncbi:SDR family oxidoreductase [Rhizobiales bacterium]|uniref:SDR family NAD(P)-dependent oxidoreductase n=1 Tax=Hongsoonwoonella zoysiae TaxID=2821844 RepID=UPI00155FD912|nr:SDR family oxidoreductase [Hongsoonwoonella zoysiae]NRG17227.1 SDR family oxidoreductase [Hongsoonwoonella zoysiae]